MGCFKFAIKQEVHRPYGHLSIRDFTPTYCQRGAYLHINSPIIIINKNQQLHRKAASQSFKSIVINEKYSILIDKKTILIHYNYI